MQNPKIKVIFVSWVKTQFPLITKNWGPPHHQRNQAIIPLLQNQKEVTTVKYRNGIHTAANPLTGLTN
jgi:hypothetical protein